MRNTHLTMMLTAILSLSIPAGCGGLEDGIDELAGGGGKEASDPKQPFLGVWQFEGSVTEESLVDGTEFRDVRAMSGTMLVKDRGSARVGFGDAECTFLAVVKGREALWDPDDQCTWATREGGKMTLAVDDGLAELETATRVRLSYDVSFIAWKGEAFKRGTLKVRGVLTR